MRLRLKADSQKKGTAAPFPLLIGSLSLAVVDALILPLELLEPSRLRQHTAAFLAGVERMAGRTDAHPDLLVGGAGFKRIAAGARHRAFLVARVDILFHL
ncbi:hypothetical protein SDC9_42991 [bioreactor metagenome]|uniref:Uncharacterized protein n=1 Tax=bioreactor metagenome TaxID=1076179 RepID=A0A644VZR1_9ZZZZ